MKKIKFWAITDNPLVKNVVEPPVSAKREIPKWYSKMSRYFFGNDIHVFDNGYSNVGLKACIPFYDAMTAGYIIKLHCDVFVKSDNGDMSFKWTSSVSPISKRAEALLNGVPEIPGYKNINAAYQIFYPFILPDGYSALITQPLNRYDLPTFVTSGIVDADSTNGGGGVPFFIKDGFEGVIPAGTPIMQVIPFKRDSWKMENLESPPKTIIKWNPQNKLTGWYKLNVWKRKNFD